MSGVDNKSLAPPRSTRFPSICAVSGQPDITRVAANLGEDEDWLWEVASEMEIEDGVIFVYGVGEDGILAFTDFGIENLIELVRIHKENPTWLKRRPTE
jgi:hypothetical protein